MQGFFAAEKKLNFLENYQLTGMIKVFTAGIFRNLPNTIAVLF